LAQLCTQQPLASQRSPVPQAGLHFWQVPGALQYEAVPQAAAQSWQLPVAPQYEERPQAVAHVGTEPSGLVVAEPASEDLGELLQLATSRAARSAAGELRFMGASRRSRAD
jgi:hypothetical protein